VSSEDIFGDQVGTVIAIVASYFIVKAAIAFARESFREARRNRDHYYLMPFLDRESMVKAIFYTLRQRGPMSSYALAEALDLNTFCTDEAVLCLTRHQYLISSEETAAAARLG
jgi:hypothetical protein